MSEPKWPALESSVSTRAPNTSVMSKETPSRSGRVSAAASASDLFGGQSEVRAVAGKEEPRSRKRKEMEEEIQMDELESIMSEDMDCFDEQPSINEGKQAQPILFTSTGKKEGLDTVEASSSSKRPRVHLEENGTNKRPQLGLETESGSSIHKKNSQKSEQRIVSIKTEPVDPLECRTAFNESSKRREVPSASTSTNIEPFEDDASFIEVRTLEIKLPQHTLLGFIFTTMFLYYHTFSILFIPVGSRTTCSRYLPA